MDDTTYRRLHPCPVCERDEMKALGVYGYRQLSMEDVLVHLMRCADPDWPNFADEAYGSF